MTARMIGLALGACFILIANPTLAGEDCFTDTVRTILPSDIPKPTFLVQTKNLDYVFMVIGRDRFARSDWRVGDEVVFCITSKSWGWYKATDQRSGEASDMALGQDVTKH
jgi:hypothetical protein